MGPHDQPGIEEMMDGGSTNVAELDRADAEERATQAWRIEQLTRLGLPSQVAPFFADIVDWHDLEKLTGRGCPLGLALEILR
jgi:hypothetical protein